jgi:lipopolysaccharide transport system ATP-binding protein
MKIVEVESVGKTYKLSNNDSPSYKNGLKSFFNSESKQVFNALTDVSFSINKGDKLGIIGNNGAGKSTLLKILSRITQPTKGNIYVRGKVASLLEVGTGFHPELSGRENIFLNGAILGMTKNEIKSQFDEIVDFAGPQIAQFLDTPVKRYSSGMYVRLGFAISAHLNPEILIVDEVLAVGDADFQKKSLGKMKEVAAQEKTILFVSHNLTAVQNLCNKTLHLENGKVKHFGETGAILNSYMAENQSRKLNHEFENFNDAPGNEIIRLKKAEIFPQLDPTIDYWTTQNSFTITFDFWSLLKSANLNISLHVFASTGECIFNIGSEIKEFESGIIATKIDIPGNFLNDGNYYISVMVVQDGSKVLYNFENLFEFEIADYRENTSWFGKWPGYVRPNFPINIVQLTKSN